jgi:CubicO group peptidase (beta-lactamase class C family)
VAGHAGLFGTAREVAAIAREQVLPAMRMLTPVGHPPERTFGLVTSRGSDAARSALPDEAVGHTGFTGTSVWIEPARQRVYVLLTNRVHPVVSNEDFQPVRNRFHLLAARLRGETPPKR